MFCLMFDFSKIASQISEREGKDISIVLSSFYVVDWFYMWFREGG